MTDTPVLLVAFNRPDRLEALVDRIRPLRPNRIYVAVDGPREHVATDAHRVIATRAVVESIDWTADVRTLFRTENLGCGRGVSGAISWLFQNEERGIILEDDVLPDPSLFPFCEELLERYADNDRVFAVSGCNFVPPEAISIPASYRFSAVPHIWGWATWRRSWSQYSYDLHGWRDRLTTSELWRATQRSPSGVAYWNAVFTLMSRQAVDTWDYQFTLAAMASGGLTATSNVNLVENVGFGPDSTHTVEIPDYLRSVESMPVPLVHPTHVRTDPGADAWTREHVFDATPSGLLRQGSRFLRRSS